MASPQANAPRLDAALSKREAIDLARRALRYGYLNCGPSADFGGLEVLAIRCPRCHAGQRTCRQYNWRPARKGEAATTDPRMLGGRRAVFEQENARQALIRVLIAHLTYPGDCQEARR